MRPRSARAPASAPIVTEAPAIARRLLVWYRRHHRDLPWRRTSDPYAIWISETMLQQTRVVAAIPYYEAFLREFPTVERLASAPLERVLARWSGLGYYTRARNVHAAAQAIVARHGGRVPDDAAALEALPGIGRYTRGAILSIAFDRPHAVLDGNVARVLARVFAVGGDARSPAMWALAEAVLPKRSAGTFNQALMELGALVCLPKAPRCEACPLRAMCRTYATASVHRFPTRRARKTPVLRAAVAAIVESRHGVWLEARAQGVNRGLFDLPAEVGDAESADALWRKLRRRLGVRADTSRHLGQIRHGILQERYRVDVWHARVSSAARARFRALAEVDALPLTARTRRALALWRGTSK